MVVHVLRLSRGYVCVGLISVQSLSSRNLGVRKSSAAFAESSLLPLVPLVGDADETRRGRADSLTSSMSG